MKTLRMAALLVLLTGAAYAAQPTDPRDVWLVSFRPGPPKDTEVRWLSCLQSTVGTQKDAGGALQTLGSSMSEIIKVEVDNACAAAITTCGTAPACKTISCQAGKSLTFAVVTLAASTPRCTPPVQP